jgi:predicted SAM-dependent methyltransferase
MKINLGCGPVQPSDWVNVDGSMRAWLASRLPWFDRCLVALQLAPATEFGPKTVYANLTKRFPWGDKSADAIYMGEVLEHFTREAGEHVLRECHRVLRPGGTLRIRVPDHARFWTNYLREYDDVRRRPRPEWSLAHTRWTEMYFRDICVGRPHLWQSIGHFHKWMYDDVSLTLLLESMGFTNVGRRPLHQSAISNVEAVETRDDLIVEGTRP